MEQSYDIVTNDRRVKIREVAETIGISIERLKRILTTHSDMKKVFTRWVRQLLTMNNKYTFVLTLTECLAMLKRKRNDFWCRFRTVDET